MAQSFGGKFLGAIIIIVISLIGGIILGTTPVGSEIQKLYHALRFREAEPAEGFLAEPFSLRIVYLQNDQGKLETYLVNKSKNEMLPIFEIEGTTQVGDAEHRLRGISEETRGKLIEILEGAKEGSSSALEKAKQLIEQLGK